MDPLHERNKNHAPKAQHSTFIYLSEEREKKAYTIQYILYDFVICMELIALNTFANDTVVRCDNKNKYDKRRQRKNGRNTLAFFPSDLLFVFPNEEKNYSHLAWCFSLSIVSCEIECVKSCFSSPTSRVDLRFVQEREGWWPRKKTFEYNNIHRRTNPIDILLWAMLPFVKSDLRAAIWDTVLCVLNEFSNKNADWQKGNN